MVEPGHADFRGFKESWLTGTAVWHGYCNILRIFVVNTSNPAYTLDCIAASVKVTP